MKYNFELLNCKQKRRKYEYLFSNSVSGWSEVVCCVVRGVVGVVGGGRDLADGGVAGRGLGEAVELAGGVPRPGVGTLVPAQYLPSPGVASQQVRPGWPQLWR